MDGITLLIPGAVAKRTGIIFRSIFRSILHAARMLFVSRKNLR